MPSRKSGTDRGRACAVNDDDLADALDHEASTRRPLARRTVVVILVSVLVVLGGVTTTVLWVQHRREAARPSPSEVEQAILGADLLTADWPVRAVAAFERDTQLTQVSRLLLTSTQVQATGPTTAVAATPPATTDWSDYLYVEDHASSLGDALVAPAAAELFELSEVNAAAIAPLAANAPGLTEISSPTAVQVVVARDPVTAGDPVRIQVFVTAPGATGLVTADATGRVLASE